MDDLATLLQQRLRSLTEQWAPRFRVINLARPTTAALSLRIGPATSKATTTSTLTQPDTIKDIHLAYLRAGADVIETNTFNANQPSMADYQMESWVEALNYEGARLAREAADQVAQEQNRPCFVAGVAPNQSHRQH